MCVEIFFNDKAKSSISVQITSYELSVCSCLDSCIFILRLLFSVEDRVHDKTSVRFCGRLISYFAHTTTTDPLLLLLLLFVHPIRQRTHFLFSAALISSLLASRLPLLHISMVLRRPQNPRLSFYSSDFRIKQYPPCRSEARNSTAFITLHLFLVSHKFAFQ